VPLLVLALPMLRLVGAMARARILSSLVAAKKVTGMVSTRGCINYCVVVYAVVYITPW